jgi:uncharacterized tellurite resistance protein B-like protein
MHILLAIVSIIGAAALLIMRLGTVARSSREIGDLAGDVMGAARRAKLRRSADASPLSTLDDPREAAVALMVAIAKTEGDLTEAQSRYIERMAVDRLGFQNGKEAIALGRWLCQGSIEPGHAIYRVIGLIGSQCDEEQKRDIISMMTEVSSIGSAPAPIQLQAIQKLNYDLGLTKAT